MTKREFIGQFERLCKGFKHDATDEQTEAWYQRLQSWDAGDWSEAVTTLLCAPRYPYLDAVLEALDQALAHRRARQLQCERKQAERIYAEIQAKEDGPLSRTLFDAIKVFSGRRQVQWLLVLLLEDKQHRELTDEERKREIARLRQEEQRLTTELAGLLPALNNEELGQFVAHYGHAAAA